MSGVSFFIGDYLIGVSDKTGQCVVCRDSDGIVARREGFLDTPIPAGPVSGGADTEMPISKTCAMPYVLDVFSIQHIQYNIFNTIYSVVMIVII